MWPRWRRWATLGRAFAESFLPARYRRVAPYMGRGGMGIARHPLDRAAEEHDVAYARLGARGGLPTGHLRGGRRGAALLRADRRLGRRIWAYLWGRA